MKNILIPEILGGVIRHAMTALGPLFIALKLIPSEQVLNEVVGAFLTLYGLVWSLLRKIRRQHEKENT